MSQDKKEVAMYNRLQVALRSVNSKPSNTALAELSGVFKEYLKQGTMVEVITLNVEKACEGFTTTDVEKFNDIVQACLDDEVLASTVAPKKAEPHKGFTDLPKLVSVTVNGGDTIDLKDQTAALAAMKKQLDEKTAEVNKLKEAQSIESSPPLGKTLFDAVVSGKPIPDDLIKEIPTGLGSMIAQAIAAKWNKALADQPYVPSATSNW